MRLLTAIGNKVYYIDKDGSLKVLVELDEGDRIDSMSASFTADGAPVLELEVSESNADDNIFLRKE